MHLRTTVWLLVLTGACAPDRYLPGDLPDAGADLSGLPCDVATVLSTKCLACHGAAPTGGTSLSLAGREALLAPSGGAGSPTYAARAVARMKDAANPMPPAGNATAEEIAALEAWVAADYPSGSCDEPLDAGTPLPEGDGTCASGRFWTLGDEGDKKMHPGVACMECHLAERRRGEDAPSYTAAGTVFPTLREPDDCNGASAATIEIIDANGKIVTLTSNSAGNFYTRAALTMPIRARVTSGDVVREMLTPVNSGDCNSCHTQEGAENAPGRVVSK